MNLLDLLATVELCCGTVNVSEVPPTCESVSTVVQRRPQHASCQHHDHHALPLPRASKASSDKQRKRTYRIGLNLFNK